MFALDGGTTESAIVEWNGERIRHAKILPNEELLTRLRKATLLSGETVAIEMLSCYGQRVGRETFLTLIWMGKFAEAIANVGGKVIWMERRKVVEHFGVTSKGKDAALKAVLESRFGVKRKGSVTEKLKSHLWQAFALAVAVHDQASPAKT